MVNQCLIAFIVLVFCLVWWFEAEPQLDAIRREVESLQKEVKTTATQVQNLADDVKAVESLIKQFMKDPEAWPEAKKKVLNSP